MSTPTTLTNLREFPPGGYPYFEPSLNWRAPNPMLPISEIAKQLQMARAQNPASGLNPSINACEEDIKTFTCTRLKGNPKYCGSLEPEPEVSASKSKATKGKRRGCKSCGIR